MLKFPSKLPTCSCTSIAIGGGGTGCRCGAVRAKTGQNLSPAHPDQCHGSARQDRTQRHFRHAVRAERTGAGCSNNSRMSDSPVRDRMHSFPSSARKRNLSKPCFVKSPIVQGSVTRLYCDEKLRYREREAELQQTALRSGASRRANDRTGRSSLHAAEIRWPKSKPAATNGVARGRSADPPSRSTATPDSTAPEPREAIRHPMVNQNRG